MRGEGIFWGENMTGPPLPLAILTPSPSPPPLLLPTLTSARMSWAWPATPPPPIPTPCSLAPHGRSPPAPHSHLSPHVQDVARDVPGDVGHQHPQVGEVEGLVQEQCRGAGYSIRGDRHEVGFIHVGGVEGGGGDCDAVAWVGGEKAGVFICGRSFTCLVGELRVPAVPDDIHSVYCQDDGERNTTGLCSV